MYTPTSSITRISSFYILPFPPCFSHSRPLTCISFSSTRRILEISLLYRNRLKPADKIKKVRNRGRNLFLHCKVKASSNASKRFCQDPLVLSRRKRSLFCERTPFCVFFNQLLPHVSHFFPLLSFSLNICRSLYLFDFRCLYNEFYIF